MKRKEYFFWLYLIQTLIVFLSGRGGQSALRFARLRMEKRHNYVRKVAEVAVQLFITNDKPNIAGLVLAGSADFKTELSQSDMFDPVSRNAGCFFSEVLINFYANFFFCKGLFQNTAVFYTYHLLARLEIYIVNVTCNWQRLTLRTSTKI